MASERVFAPSAMPQKYKIAPGTKVSARRAKELLLDLLSDGFNVARIATEALIQFLCYR